MGCMWMVCALGANGVGLRFSNASGGGWMATRKGCGLCSRVGRVTRGGELGSGRVPRGARYRGVWECEWIA